MNSMNLLSKGTSGTTGAMDKLPDEMKEMKLRDDKVDM